MSNKMKAELFVLFGYIIPALIVCWPILHIYKYLGSTYTLLTVEQFMAIMAVFLMVGGALACTPFTLVNDLYADSYAIGGSFLVCLLLALMAAATLEDGEIVQNAGIALVYPLTWLIMCYLAERTPPATTTEVTVQLEPGTTEASSPLIDWEPTPAEVTESPLEPDI